MVEALRPKTGWRNTEGRTTLPRSSPFLRRVCRFLGVAVAVAALTAIDFRVVHANSATAAFSYLLLILGLATRAGLPESIAASFASTLAYNFFFLPPIGTLTVADPQNWVALVAFLVTAITASQLSTSARRKAEEAGFRQQELQRMYNFSRALMLKSDEPSLANQITRQISELFDAQDVWFYDCATNSVCKITTPPSPLEESLLREVGTGGQIWRKTERGALIVPVRLGGRCLGSLGVAGAAFVSEVALQAIAQLVAIAMERTRAQELTARAEAARQNEQLKSTLLDALAHEFKTPLTSIKAAATTVLSRNTLNEMERDLVSVVDEEADHLDRLVSEAIELARIGASPVTLHREPCSVDELISSAVTQLRRLSEGRVLELAIKRDLPLIEIDRRLSELALRQLLNNALKYSPPSSAIQVTAESQGDNVMLRVCNAGQGIPRSEQDLIFEKFYRGREARARIAGTGMGLTIARDIIEAHGGRIWLASEPAKGVQFSFTLPTFASVKAIRQQRQQTVA